MTLFVRQMNYAHRQRFACLLFIISVFISFSAFANAPKLLIIGDSLSAGYGIASEEGWVQLLADRLKAKNMPCNVINASESGIVTAQGRARLPNLIMEHQPQFLLIELGANDGLRGLSLKNMQANLQAMIDLAKQDNINVMLVGVRLPPNYGTEYTQAFAQVYLRLAHTNRDIIMAPKMLNNIAEHRQLMQADNIHPTAAAQSMILDNLWPGIATLLSAQCGDAASKQKDLPHDQSTTSN